MSNGYANFNMAMKIATVPYPFPYMQTTELLLFLNWLIAPVVVVAFTTTPFWAGIFTFLDTFALWCLNSIAAELENPYGEGVNYLRFGEMQNRMNKRLITLLW